MYNYKSEEAKIYDFIIYNELANEEEISLCANVAGYSVETLNAIIYARTAYHDAPQCLACEPGNFVDVCGDFTEDEEEENEH